MPEAGPDAIFFFHPLVTVAGKTRIGHKEMSTQCDNIEGMHRHGLSTIRILDREIFKRLEMIEGGDILPHVVKDPD